MKRYTPGDEARLIEEVERQNGRYLPETCMAEEIDDLALPNMSPPLSSGCEEDALFLVAYDPFATVEVNEPILEPDPDPDAPSGRRRSRKDAQGVTLYEVVERGGTGSPDGTLGTARVCANDDMLRFWPRFKHVIQHSDPLTGGA